MLGEHLDVTLETGLSRPDRLSRMHHLLRPHLPGVDLALGGEAEGTMIPLEEVVEADAILTAQTSFDVTAPHHHHRPLSDGVATSCANQENWIAETTDVLSNEGTMTGGRIGWTVSVKLTEAGESPD